MINTVLEAYLQAVLSLSQAVNDDDKQQGKECAGEDIEYPLQPIEESKHLYSEEDDTINKGKQKREVNVFTRSHRVDGRLKVILAVALHEQFQHIRLQKTDECHGRGCHTGCVRKGINVQPEQETP